MHSHGVAADEVAAKVDTLQTVQLGVQTRNLPDVIADGDQERLGHVSVAEIASCWSETSFKISLFQHFVHCTNMSIQMNTIKCIKVTAQPLSTIVHIIIDN